MVKHRYVLMFYPYNPTIAQSRPHLHTDDQMFRLHPGGRVGVHPLVAQATIGWLLAHSVQYENVLRIAVGGKNPAQRVAIAEQKSHARTALAVICTIMRSLTETTDGETLFQALEDVDSSITGGADNVTARLSGIPPMRKGGE